MSAGVDLADALAAFGQQEDCIGCSTAIAAPAETPVGSIDQVRGTFTPLAKEGAVIRPGSGASGIFRRGGHWTEIDIDARAQRLRSVRMPTALVDAQRLLAVNDLRGNNDMRPLIAIGLWARFAHPVVRIGARFGGTTDGLTAEIALSVHPDRYVMIDSDRKQGITFVVSTHDIVVAELIVLALRQRRLRVRGVGPWEDPLVQAATDLSLGVRNAEEIGIDAILSPTLSSHQREGAASSFVQAAELIGVRTYR